MGLDKDEGYKINCGLDGKKWCVVEKTRGKYCGAVVKKKEKEEEK